MTALKLFLFRSLKPSLTSQILHRKAHKPSTLNESEATQRGRSSSGSTPSSCRASEPTLSWVWLFYEFFFGGLGFIGFRVPGLGFRILVGAEVINALVVLVPGFLNQNGFLHVLIL